jgi:small-conductance mechanosensitive channel
VAPGRVLAALREAAEDVPGSVPGSTAKAFACEFRDTLIAYELTVPIETFARKMEVQSELVQRVAAALAHEAIPIGSPALAVRMVPVGAVPPVVAVVKALR